MFDSDIYANVEQATMLKKTKMKRRLTEPNIASASQEGAKSSNE